MTGSLNAGSSLLILFLFVIPGYLWQKAGIFSSVKIISST